jgi:hypothetical protein
MRYCSDRRSRVSTGAASEMGKAKPRRKSKIEFQQKGESTMKKSLNIGACLVATVLALSFQVKNGFGQPGQLASVTSATTNIVLPPIVLPSAPSIIGSYSVSFYSDPFHVLTATQCIVFSKGTSPIVGLSNSGNWHSTTFAGWQGQWVQEGLHVQWYGFTSGGLASSADGNMFTNDSRGTNTSNLGAGFFSTFVRPGTTSNAGSYLMTRVSSCPSALLLESFEPSADPSGQK